MGASPHRKCPAPVLLGGDRQCGSDCGKSFPRVRIGGQEKMYCGESCKIRAKYLRALSSSPRPDRAAKARAAALIKIQEGGGLKIRPTPYDRRKQCLTDGAGRDNPCVNYGLCLDLQEQGRPTILEMMISAGRKEHCYEKTPISAGIHGISGSGYGAYAKHTGPKGGCE